MLYYQIALRQVRDLYTWESAEKLNPGDRVKVTFRHRERLGIVVVQMPEPDFKTSAVLALVDPAFVPEASFKLAWYLSQTHFTPLAKVLSLMIPEPFWHKATPAKYIQTFVLDSTLKVEALRHPTQKKFYAFLEEQYRTLNDDELPLEFKNTFKTFVKHGWLQLQSQCLKTEFSLPKTSVPFNIKLTLAQQTVLQNLQLQTGGSMLWGVTGSGKTEIYKQYFQALLEGEPGTQFLLLLPEIALTPQLIADFTALFGHHVAVWHSNLSTSEKVQAFSRIQSGEASILIGTRSAALVPIPNLRAIVVDEEHEWTFKNEFNPRFWTHEVVEFLAKEKNIPYVYGSATPKLRTYHQTQNGALNLVELEERVHQTSLPTIELVDLKQESKRGNFEPVSARLQEAITKTLADGKQVVLFLNKRGFAGSAMCRFCGDPFMCDHCDMALKLHRQGTTQRLICHVCGSMKAFPKACPSCNQEEFTFRGWGTQQLETQLENLFPQTKVFRADRDSITGRYDFEKLLDAFKSTPQSILLGTQMIAKGLDFESVALVGIVLADVGLHLPDYNAEERVYQLLEQVSGRAGRRHTQGHIVVQTYQPELPMFEFLQQHDTKGFMAAKYAEHQRLGLPPLSQVVKIIIADPSKASAFATCKSLHLKLQTALKDQKLDEVISANWAPAFFPKLHGKYWFYVFLKSADEVTLTKFIQNYNWPEGVKIDVSPVSLI